MCPEQCCCTVLKSNQWQIGRLAPKGGYWYTSSSFMGPFQVTFLLVWLTCFWSHFSGIWIRLQSWSCNNMPGTLLQGVGTKSVANCQIDFEWNTQLYTLFFRAGIVLQILCEGCNTIFFGRIHCAAEFWNQTSGKFSNWFWRVHCAELTRWWQFSLRLVSSCRIDLKYTTFFFGSVVVLESNQWQIGKLILKGALRTLRRVDEVVTLFCKD